MQVSTIRVGLAVIYGIVLIVGGIIGYFKTGSLISGIMGSLSGLAVIGLEYAFLTGIRSKSDSSVSSICIAQAAVAGILVVAMGFRYFKTGKFMPAGLVLSLSFFMGFVYMTRVLNLSSSIPVVDVPAMQAENAKDL